MAGGEEAGVVRHGVTHHRIEVRVSRVRVEAHSLRPLLVPRGGAEGTADPHAHSVARSPW